MVCHLDRSLCKGRCGTQRGTCIWVDRLRRASIPSAQHAGGTRMAPGKAGLPVAYSIGGGAARNSSSVKVAPVSEAPTLIVEKLKACQSLVTILARDTPMPGK